jgi:hypothetical protein
MEHSLIKMIQTESTVRLFGLIKINSKAVESKRCKIDKILTYLINLQFDST